MPMLSTGLQTQSNWSSRVPTRYVSLTRMSLRRLTIAASKEGAPNAVQARQGVFVWEAAQREHQPDVAVSR